MVGVPKVTRADAQAALRNPLAFIADRWTPDPRTVRRAALAALVMSVVIVVTGGAVRLTGSGLGCPTWPECTDGSLTTTRAMGWHGAIEFGNRMLTYVLCAAVGWAIIAARSQKPWRRSLTRLGWAQFWVVMGNAVLGGIVVLVGLNPYTVAAHFLLTIALMAVATVSDLFNGQHYQRVVSTPTLTQVYERSLVGRTTFVGLVYSIGVAKKEKQPSFEYESGADR